MIESRPGCQVLYFLKTESLQSVPNSYYQSGTVSFPPPRADVCASTHRSDVHVAAKERSQ
jgi:hypothetical protein